MSFLCSGIPNGSPPAECESQEPRAHTDLREQPTFPDLLLPCALPLSHPSLPVAGPWAANIGLPQGSDLTAHSAENVPLPDSHGSGVVMAQMSAYGEALPDVIWFQSYLLTPTHPTLFLSKVLITIRYSHMYLLIFSISPPTRM